MPSQPSRDALTHLLQQRDAEIHDLRTQLAAMTAMIIPGAPHPADVAHQMQALHGGMLVTDAQGHITWANETLLDRCHCTRADLLGTTLAHLPLGLPLTAADQAAVGAGLARQEAFAFEVADAKPLAERTWLAVKVHPVRNAEQAVTMFVGLLEDVSAKRRAQLALGESEEQYRFLAEHVPCVLYRIFYGADGTRQILYCSPRLKELFGIDRLELLQGFMHPDDRVEAMAAINTALVTNGILNIEYRLVVPGQPLRWCRAQSVMSSGDERGMVHSGSMEDITMQRQAESLAQQNELRAMLVREGVGISRWEYYYDNNCATLSEECKNLLGYTDQPWPEKSWMLMDYVHPDDRPVLVTAWAQYHGGETSIFACEHRLRCHDGSYRWMLNRGLVTKQNSKGAPELFTGFVGDIHTRKLSQQAQVTTALRLTTTIKNLKHGVLLVDENGKIVLSNHSFCQLFGLCHSPEELIGTDYAAIEILIEKCLDGPVGDVPAKSMATVVRERREVRHGLFRLHNGRIAERDFVPVREGDMDIGFLWGFEDITDSYLTEISLRLREEKYRTVIDNMQLGLVEIDLEKRVVYANPNYCRLIGYSSEELLGHPLPEQLIPAGSQPYFMQQFRQRTNGIGGSYELLVVSKTGETKWLFTGASPLYDQHRAVVGSIGISLDITQQKELEQGLREAKLVAEHSTRAKELFLANMSHEIRTPMNAILGMSQLLAKTPLAPKQSNFLHAITTSAQNLLVIINDILDLSKLDAGQMTLEQVGFNVNRLCEQVRKTLLYKAEEKGLVLAVKMNPLVPDVVLGDPYRLTQILLNLASNAVKFTEKGEVTIECEVVHFQEGTVELAFVVRDTGIGIAPEYLKRIFQEFSQEDPSITRQFGGTGLGLSICRSLAQLMHSEIVIESEKNVGTVASFTLPLPISTVDDLPHRSLVSSTNLRDLRGKRVLLVEDNEYNRLMAKTFLLNAHLKVTEAENGQEAIDCARQHAFDLILMDVQMPVLDGFEATRHLRQDLGLTLPIIALTASAISGEKERCLAAGMDDYLAKPFFEDELLQLLCDWLLKPEAGPLAPPLAPTVVPTMLYNLEVLQSMARGDQKFVSSMLQTFINSSQRTLHDLHAALAVGNLAGLQAAAHKLRPSLRHLQIHSVLQLMDLLENWAGPFSYDDLQPPVAAADRILRQVLAEMTAEQDKRRAAGH